MASDIKQNIETVTKTNGVRKTYQRKRVITRKQNKDTKSEPEQYVYQHTELQNSNVLICRVCLNEGDVPIHGDGNFQSVAEPLALYGGIELHEDDEFPKYLCHDCHEQLQSTIKFRQTAQETEQLLRESYLPVEAVSDDMDSKEMLGLVSHHLDSKEIEENDGFFKETLADSNTVYCCRECDIYFETSQEYGQHILFTENHVNIKDQCPFCCRQYSCIQKHLTMHRVARTILCQICDHKFLEVNFMRHQLTHGVELSYKCSLCPYQGRYAGDFKIHMRKHTGERPYRCSECPAGFISKSNLNRHMLTHKLNYNFQCSECPKGFNNQQNLDTHIKVNHLGVREHLCNLCGKAYGYKKALMKHQLQVHKRDKLRSGRCPVYLKLQPCANEYNSEEEHDYDHAMQSFD